MARAIPQASEDGEVLAGLVERVVFHSPETGFCVLRVEARGRREAVTIVGQSR
jgi:exodeoxyribonuclease V alpha subunit